VAEHYQAMYMLCLGDAPPFFLVSEENANWLTCVPCNP
jgi:hypothetical protein